MTGAESAAGAEETTGAEAATGAQAIRIVRGEPTAEELAALVAVLAAAAAAAGSGQDRVLVPPAVSGWTDHARYVGAAVAPGPNGWRAAAFPR